jgi:sugar/nucleoside kinase (ribokinase family)
MTRPAIEVVHIGSACRDIAPEDPRGWRIGGGVMYAALTTARLGLRTAAVVGVDDAAAGARELDLLSDAGVDVLRVPLREGPIYHNVETPAGRVQTSVQPGMPLPIPVLPAASTEAPGWSVVAVAGEVHDDWADVIPPDAHVAVAWQGFLRDLRAGERVQQLAPRPSPILARADLVGVSRHDVAPDVPLRALWSLLRPGADLLITQGVDGGLLIRLGDDGPEGILRYRSPASDAEVDPTGAGDTFLAALHASGLRWHAGNGAARATPATRELVRDRMDLRFAAAAGSLVVEDLGLHGVATLPVVTARRDRDHAPDAVESVGAEEATEFWPESTTVD